jgi:long-subunit acyl-CoA synthetase (AMP-forming)
MGRDASLTVSSRAHGAWENTETPFGSEVRRLAAALSCYGLGAGARAAVLGTEGRQTLRAGLAVIAAGATLVPLDPAGSDDALRRALASTGCVHAIASDEHQLARILALRPELPALELLLLCSAEPSERKPAALLVDAAMEVGAGALTDDPDVLRTALSESEGGAACLLVDGTGATKSISRTALLALAESLAESLRFGPGNRVLVALPVGGVERLAAALGALDRGATLLLPSPAERPDSGLDQSPADAILLDLTGLGRLHRAWLEDIDSKSWFSRRATRWALRQGSERTTTSWKRRVAESVALRALREKLGGKTKSLDVIGCAPGSVSGEVVSFFSAIGVTLRYPIVDTAVPLAR